MLKFAERASSIIRVIFSGESNSNRETQSARASTDGGGGGGGGGCVTGGETDSLTPQPAIIAAASAGRIAIDSRRRVTRSSQRQRSSIVRSRALSRHWPRRSTTRHLSVGPDRGRGWMGTVLLGAMQFLLATQATQGMQATIGGSVRDEQSGAVLAGAEVVLTDLNQATLTDADGRYLMHRVPAGAQHITVRFLGHAPRTLHALVPPSGHVEINVSLRSVAFRLSSVKIRPPVAVRGFATGDSMTFADRTSSIAAVRNHPMLAEPDVLQALEVARWYSSLNRRAVST